jgi:hypothetical protein
MDEEYDLENKPCMLQECLRLQAAEKSFYDVLGQKYPHSSCDDSTDPEGNFDRAASFESKSSSCTTDNSYESDWINLVGESDTYSLQLQTPFVEQIYSDLTEPDPVVIQQQAASHFQNGTWSWNDIQPVMVEEISASIAPREKRSYKINDDESCIEQEGRGSKISAIFSDELEPPEILDEVLLYQSGRSKNQQPSQNLDSGGKSKATRSRPKKVSNNNATAVDLWTMLTLRRLSRATIKGIQMSYSSRLGNILRNLGMDSSV